MNSPSSILNDIMVKYNVDGYINKDKNFPKSLTVDLNVDSDGYEITFEFLNEISIALKTKDINFIQKHESGFAYSEYTWQGSRNELTLYIDNIGI